LGIPTLHSLQHNLQYNILVCPWSVSDVLVRYNVRKWPRHLHPTPEFRSFWNTPDYCRLYVRTKRARIGVECDKRSDTDHPRLPAQFEYIALDKQSHKRPDSFAIFRSSISGVFGFKLQLADGLCTHVFSQLTATCSHVCRWKQFQRPSVF